MERFDCFVVFAEMRTGSNFLEETLNGIGGVTCYGEAFNPGFIGHQDQLELLGVDLEARESDPLSLITAMKAKAKGLSGFRYFHDHDPRVLRPILDDPKCAKIILARNPLESFVSLQIARATGQWKLTDAKDRKSAKAHFDAEEFTRYLEKLTRFRSALVRGLQKRGQTAFHIAYEQIGDARVVRGLSHWLGAGVPEHAPDRLKPQNPGSPIEKVSNPDEMREALHHLDPFALLRADGIEPRRGPAVPTFVATSSAPLLLLPMKGGPTQRLEAWLAAIDGGSTDALVRGFNQKTLRQWKNRSKDARSFVVLTHPALRLHRVFCRYILSVKPGSFAEIRAALRSRYKVQMPDGAAGANWDAAAHRAAFLGFLKFARANLAGQTSLRSDPAWSSQSALLQGFAEVLSPDMILREAKLELGLRQLSEQVGRASPPLPAPSSDDEGPAPHPLSSIYDDEVETAVRAVHNRDFMAFGFRPWAKEA